MVRKFNTLKGWRPGRMWVSGDLLLEIADEIQSVFPLPSADSHEVRYTPDGVAFGIRPAVKELIWPDGTGQRGGAFGAYGMTDDGEWVREGSPMASRSNSDWAANWVDESDSSARESMKYSGSYSWGSQLAAWGISGPPIDPSGVDPASATSNASSDFSDRRDESSASGVPKTAKVPVAGGKFLNWHCVESPDVAFRDRVPVWRFVTGWWKRPRYYVRIPRLYLESVVVDSIRVEEVAWAEGSPIPMRFGVSDLIGCEVGGWALSFIELECNRGAVPDSVVLRGDRRDVANGDKYQAATEAAFLSNGHFWSTPMREA